MRSNRILCFLLTLLMLFACIPELSLSASAADYPTTHPNTYVNTGDQRKDIVAVAVTQVGYKEGSGNNNYTKYGAWWGRNPMSWCAIFVSWCAEQAGVPESVIKQNSFSNAAAFGFSSSFTASQKKPQPGDLFFRNTDAHAGIVYKVEGSTFYTVEGNTWTSADSRHGVMIRERELYSSQYTFVSPNYQGSGNAGTSTGCNHSYVKGAENQHPHKEYYKCSKCGHSYYTGTNKVVDGCQDCCEHRFENWKKVDDTYHSAVCGICGKNEKIKHEWGSDETVTEPTCKDPGVKKQTCAQCGATRETEIPATGEHQFGPWLYSDSHNHYRVCEVCETEEEAEHTLSEWVAGSLDHWYECEDCGGKLSIGSHQLSGSCGTKCMICGLVPNSGHMYSSRWTSNSKNHWHRCLHCSDTKEEAAHVYSADCDETCDTCGYIRQVTHTYGTQWESDSSGHWRTCQKCGKKQTAVSHKTGTAATENQAQLCTVCGFEVTPAGQHMHSYRFTYDDRNHWGTCACGDTVEAQGHIWQMETGKCEVCQAAMPSAEDAPVVLGIRLPAVLKAPWFWKALLYGAAGIILLVILILLIAGVRRRIRYNAMMALRQEFAEEDALEEQEETQEQAEEAPTQEPVSV